MISRWIIFCGGMVFFGFASFASANVTTIVKPNGGECLETGVAYTIEFSWSGADVKHVALYYRTDGQQPAHLDSSEIRHPINVPQQGTTWDWTPKSSHISETGRIWVDGHETGHLSLNTWDSSDGNIFIRSGCGGAGAGISTPGGFENQAKVADLILATSSARIRFESPWDGEYRVRLLEERDGFIRNVAFKDAVVKFGDILEFKEVGLSSNTLYNRKFFIRAYDFAFGFESIPSEITPPFWTILEEPRIINVSGLGTSSVVLSAPAPPNLKEGLTAVLFEEIDGEISSGWMSTTTWQVKNLKPGTEYQFWAKFRNGGGVETPLGGLVLIKTLSVEEEVKKEVEVFAKQLQELKTKIVFLEKTIRLVAEGRGISLVRKIAKEPESLARKREVGEQLKKRIVVKEEPAVSTTTLPLIAAPRRPPKTFFVIIENNSFNPNLIEIQAGDTIRWINKSDRPFWPASDPHPTHTALSSFDSLGDILREESYRYTFRHPGRWFYHNHTQAKVEEKTAATGIIIVNP